MRILGVDPGSRLTGYGCIDLVGNQLKYVAHGTLKLSDSFEARLLALHEGLSEMIQKYKPDVMSIEKVFFAKNALSALKLGQARGAAILTGMINGLTIVEYSPTEVKQTVCGQGHADKHQVARMVQILTGHREFQTLDASDGMALAICHAYTAMTLERPNSDYAKALRTVSSKRSKKKLSMAESLGLKSSDLPKPRRKTL